jgi:hypothetical protein
MLMEQLEYNRGADKGYDSKDFVAEEQPKRDTARRAKQQRAQECDFQLAVRNKIIDGRTTRYTEYLISQRKRKRVEEIFGWMKTVGGMRKLRHRGLHLVGWMFTFAAPAYNLVRIRNLASAIAGANA